VNGTSCGYGHDARAQWQEMTRLIGKVSTFSSEHDPCVLAAGVGMQLNVLAWLDMPANDCRVWWFSDDDSGRDLFTSLEKESRIEDTVLVHVLLLLILHSSRSKPRADSRHLWGPV